MHPTLALKKRARMGHPAETARDIFLSQTYFNIRLNCCAAEYNLPAPEQVVVIVTV